MNKSIFLVLISLFVVSHFALAQPLKDKNEETMRGYPMIISKQWSNTTKFALDPENWQTLKDSSLNTVRLCWVGPWVEDRIGEDGFDWINGIWSMDEVAETIDSCVKIATLKGMNIIINYHNVGEQENNDGVVSDEDINMERLNEFWAKVAPMHKDNDLVYYELLNEPWFWGDPYTKEPFKTNLVNLYDSVRTLAPEREILMFTFNNMGYNFSNIMSSYDKYLDWDHTTVAYHMYSTSSSKAVVELAKTHKVMCTEWFYPSSGEDFVVEVDGYKINGQALEAIGHSWCDWHDWDDATFDHTFKELFPDAIEKQYAWWIDNPTSILEEEVKKGEIVYPNPTKGIINFEEELRFEVYTLEGVLLQKGTASKVDLSQYSNGMYLLKLKDTSVKIVRL